MLLGLRISNFAVIDELEVSFAGGLTVLTGETGAGKSILLDALSLLLGGRADTDVVRAGEEEALVEGTFLCGAELSARLELLGLPHLGEELSIRRTIGKSGRGKAHVNGSLVTVGVLARLASGLVDIAGQHEQMRLFDPSAHASFLDRQPQVEPHRAAYLGHWHRLSELTHQMAELEGDETAARQRAEFVRFQLDELLKADPKPQEDDALESERRKLSATEKLRRVAAESEALLSGEDGSALAHLQRVAVALTDAARLDSALSVELSAIATSVAECESAARSLGRYRERLEAQPERLLEVEERLSALKRLCRKHGVDALGLCQLKDKLKQDLDMLEQRTERLNALEAARDSLYREAQEAAGILSRARHDAAAKLSSDVGSGLRLLSLAKAQFDIRVEPLSNLGPEGMDRVEFFFSGNPAEPLRPLAKVASGGEASRVGLAIKRSLAQTDPCATYVLDEADAGVSGGVAEVVGRVMKEVSSHKQVLCITHLPQVAAFADQHLSVQKKQVRGRASTEVVSLTAEEREQELARMLSGVKLTPEALGAARALIRNASGGTAGSSGVKGRKDSRGRSIRPHSEQDGRNEVHVTGV